MTAVPPTGGVMKPNTDNELREIAVEMLILAHARPGQNFDNFTKLVVLGQDVRIHVTLDDLKGVKVEHVSISVDPGQIPSESVIKAVGNAFWPEPDAKVQVIRGLINKCVAHMLKL